MYHSRFSKLLSFVLIMSVVIGMFPIKVIFADNSVSYSDNDVSVFSHLIHHGTIVHK